MNRWFRVVLVATSLLVVASLVNGQTPRGGARLTGDYANSWALLIGMRHTPGKAELQGSVADAERMKAALIKLGFPEKNIRVLRNPKGAEIRDVILRPFEGMSPNDRYVVYFSGHGDSYSLLDGTEEGYLLAADFNRNNLLNTAISMRQIREYGRQMPVKHVLFILDACNAGHAVTMTGSDVPSSPEALKPYLRGTVTEILAAGLADQNAYQINRQGIFTRWVVNSIDGFLARQSGLALTTNVLWGDVSAGVGAESEGKLTPPAPYSSNPQAAFVLWFPPPSAPSLTIRIKPDYGTVVIRSKLPGFEVWLGQQKVGVTKAGEMLEVDVPAGKHRLRGTKAGQQWEREVEVAANQRAEVMIDIEPLRPPEPARTIRTEDGAEMVLVPAGEFTMGSSREEVNRAIEECKKAGVADDKCKEWMERELGVHRVWLDAFYLDRYEVTNALFEAFVRVTGHRTTAEREGWGWVWQQKDGKWQFVKENGAEWRKPNGPTSSAARDHPVVQASWDDASAYCRWAGKRLPTEAEWEKAARGTDARRYPWGEAWDESRVGEWKNNRTHAVGTATSGVSPYGAHDMAGNVTEWVADWLDATYYQRSPNRNPQGPESGQSRVLRGGSWGYDPINLRTTYRDSDTPDLRNSLIGFRCARGT